MAKGRRDEGEDGDLHHPPERLNFLIDGVYAIVMTLLVLELKIPEGLTPSQATHHLAGLGPKFVAYGVGFGIAASGWAFVHGIGRLFQRSSLLHILLNLMALMVASLLPFSASVMGALPEIAIGPQIYALNVGGLTLIYGLDVILCGPFLFPRSVGRGLFAFIVAGCIGMTLWCLVIALEIAPYSPRLALGALALHFVGHWIFAAVSDKPIRRAASLGDTARKRAAASLRPPLNFSAE
jgi:hypothetical protein